MEEITRKAKAPAKPRKTAAKKTTNPSNVTEMPLPAAHAKVTEISAQPVSYEKVAELAHRYWNERGREHGHHVEDWFRAEQELRGKAS